MDLMVSAFVLCFCRFGIVFVYHGMVFDVFAWKRNGLGGMSSQTITFPSKTAKTIPIYAKTIPDFENKIANT